MKYIAFAMYTRKRNKLVWVREKHGIYRVPKPDGFYVWVRIMGFNYRLETLAWFKRLLRLKKRDRVEYTGPECPPQYKTEIISRKIHWGNPDNIKSGIFVCKHDPGFPDADKRDLIWSASIRDFGTDWDEKIKLKRIRRF